MKYLFGLFLCILIFSCSSNTTSNSKNSSTGGLDYDPAEIKLLTEKAQNISVDKLYDIWKKSKDKDIIILDVRSLDEYTYMDLKDWKTPGGHIPGAWFADYQQVIDKLDGKTNAALPIDNMQDKTIYIICTAGVRSVWVYNKMKEKGYKDIYNVPEGMQKWTAKHYPYVKGLPGQYRESAMEGFADLLKNHVKNGRVDYPAFKSPKLQLFLKYIAYQNIEKFTQNEKLSFYINAYNAICIKQILDDYEKIKHADKGPLAVEGFFDQKKYKLSSKLISLNEIENKIVRPQFKEAKIHFALVCGALSCPILINEAYDSKSLKALLTENAKRYLNSDYGFKLENNTLYLSQIFDWFKEDFGETQDYKGVRTFIAQYKPDLKKEISSSKIQFMPYNWRLNSK